MMQRGIIVKLLSLCHPGATVELRASAALFVAEVLACIGSKETCKLVRRACDST